MRASRLGLGWRDPALVPNCSNSVLVTYSCLIQFCLRPCLKESLSRAARSSRRLTHPCNSFERCRGDIGFPRYRGGDCCHFSVCDGPPVLSSDNGLNACVSDSERRVPAVFSTAQRQAANRSLQLGLVHSRATAVALSNLCSLLATKNATRRWIPPLCCKTIRPMKWTPSPMRRFIRT